MSSTDGVTKQRAKLYILDRTRGTSKPDLDKKPPCFICFIPKPVYRLACCMEQNVVCDTVGRIGCFGHDDFKVRRFILSFGLAANVFALLLSIFACFAVTKQFQAIRVAGFSEGIVSVPSTGRIVSHIDVGLRAVAFENFRSSPAVEEVGQTVISFDEFCGLVGNGLDQYMNPEDCNHCAEVSQSLVITVMFSVIAVIPSITTDVLRMYPNYDLNCQKFFGSIISFLSFLLSMYTWLGYTRDCFAGFLEGTIPYYLNGTVATDPQTGEVTLDVLYDWRAGNGIICLLLATALKIIDIIAVVLIPTPDIAHTRALQEEYEERYAGDSKGEVDLENGVEADLNDDDEDEEEEALKTKKKSRK